MSITPNFNIYIDIPLDKLKDFIINATKNTTQVKLNSDNESICIASSENDFDLLYEVFDVTVLKADKQSVKIAQLLHRIKIDYQWIFGINPGYQFTYYTEIMKFVGIIMRQYPGDCTLTTDGGITVFRRVDGQTTVDLSFNGESKLWLPEELGVPYQFGVIEKYDDESDETWDDDNYVWH